MRSLSFNEIGGPRQTTIKATGDQAALANTFDLLGCPIEIRNQRGEPVWWGRVVGVVAGNEGVSLDDMSKQHCHRIHHRGRQRRIDQRQNGVCSGCAVDC